jgi:protein-S-isoprenylcysteine O-methyltransferase Ste14
MSEHTFYTVTLVTYLVLAALTFPLLLVVAAPYGRYADRSWQGPTLDNRLAWLVMEAPAAIVFALCFVFGAARDTTLARVFFLLWQSHYAYRAFIYPFTLRGRGKRMPLLIAASAFVFNVANGYLNGRYLFTFSGGYPDSWLRDPRFIAGVLLFYTGYVICRQSDAILRGLRRPGEAGYRIPSGGLFRYVAAPNYLGEIIQWGGWALATWSLPGLAFFLWVLANLVPRARAHRRWYRQTFPDFPPERRALVPGVW